MDHLDISSNSKYVTGRIRPHPVDDGMNLQLLTKLLGPRLAVGAPTTLLKPSYPNASISSLSPLTRGGSCWKCGIEAPGGIRLVYWQPDNAAVGGSNVTLGQSDALPYTQVENGFTYTSPSVYVIYSSLRGTAACSTESGLYAVGPAFSQKTLAYSSRFLAYGSLSIADAGCSEFVVVDGFHTIDFSSLYYSPITTTTTYKAGCAPYVNPRLSLPHELTNVDPRWENCEPLFYGAFDPPSIITKASGALAPSPVGAGRITQPAIAQPASDPALAVPAVTFTPPVAAPTGAVEVSHPLPLGDGGPNLPGVPASSAASAAIDALTPQAEGPSNIDHTQASAPPQGAPSNPLSGSLGQFINSPFVPEQNEVQPGVNPSSSAEATPIAPGYNGPPVSSPHVAVPVKMENGKLAYAIVDAKSASAEDNNAQMAVLPTPDSPSGQQSAVYSQNEPDIVEAEPTSSPGGMSKVTLNDGSTAEIPTADIVESPNPKDDEEAAHIRVSGLQSVSLQAGAYVAVSGVDGAPSSVAVQGGNYLLPNPTKDTPQEMLTLLNGETTAIPLAIPTQGFTLRGGRVTNIPINGPAQILTLEDGAVSTLSPIHYSVITLANGQVTSVPGAKGASESSDDSVNMPLQILTLENGQTTAVPIQVSSQTFTLQDGTVTTLPADAPTQILTLADGKISTISPIPLATLTLADGKVTSVPIMNPGAGSGEGSINIPLQTLTLENGQVTTVPLDSSPEIFTLANGVISTVTPNPLTVVTLTNGEVTSIPATYTPSLAADESFLTIPDATISGHVYYTRLPIVSLQNATSNQSQIGKITQNNSSDVPTSASANAESIRSNSITSLPTSLKTSNNAMTSAATNMKTSLGNEIGRNVEFGARVVVAIAAIGLGLV